jgi:SNF2 family DNA or RNA helicase
VLLFDASTGAFSSPSQAFAIVSVLMPRGSQKTLKQFKDHFWNPIKAGQKYGAPLSAIHLKDTRIAEMNVWLAGVALRREKKQVKLDLPTKEDHVVFCALTPMQIRVYRRMLASYDIQSILVQKPDARGVMFRSFQAHRAEDGTFTACGPACPACLILPCITYLGKIANHLGLLQLEHVAGDPHEERYRALRSGNAVASEIAKDQVVKLQEELGGEPMEREAAKRERMRVLAKMCLADDADAIGGLYRHTSAMTPLMTSEETCGKLKALRALLKAWYRTKPRCKVLLFSNSTQMLDILTAFTTRQGYISRRIDGQTPQKRRSQIVKEFHQNAGIFLLLLSTKAGGVGLNLCAANVVVIFDPSWNPASVSAPSAQLLTLTCSTAHSSHRLAFCPALAGSPSSRSRLPHRPDAAVQDLPIDRCRMHRGAGLPETGLQAAADIGCTPPGDQAKTGASKCETIGRGRSSERKWEEDTSET